MTKIDKAFLRLIASCFPQHHKSHKHFNQNKLKISYSCMPNVKSVINKHNKTVLDLPTNTSEKICNYINKEKCPSQEKVLNQ